MTRRAAYILCIFGVCLVSLLPAQAQMSKKELKQLNQLEFSIVDFFDDYNIEGAEVPSAYENYKFNRETKILEVFGKLKKSGEKNIYLVKSDKMLLNDNIGTIEGTHFTDIGFQKWADAVYKVMKGKIK